MTSMAELLPPQAYKDPPVFQAERRSIFGSGWQVVAPAAALPEAGCYVAIGLGGWALFAMRGEDGAVRAFNNVCSHQKMPVLDNGRGRCEGRLRCRYHGWTYDTLGRLVAAPPPVAPEDDEFEDYPLDQLPCKTVSGLVFARIAGSAQAGAEPADMLAAAGVGEAESLDGLVLAGSDLRAIEPNWKAVVDVLLGGIAAPPVSADGRFAWINPTTGLWREADGVAVLQVVPRSFRKTELHVSMLAETAEPPPSLAERTTAWIDTVVAAAADRQQAALEGTPPEPAVAEKLAKLHGWFKLAAS